jgi:antitoxin HicB
MKGIKKAAPAALAYPALFEPEPEGGFTITFPEAGIGVSYGATWDNALAQAEDLLEEAVLGYMAHDENIPQPVPQPDPQRPLIFLPPLTAAKLLLYWALREEGISKAELARKLNIAAQQVQYLFDGRHASRLDQIEAALRALGRRLVVSSEAARSEAQKRSI